MKKVIYNSYGNENVLEIIETPVPVPNDDQVLVKVKAVSVNPLDWKVRNGSMKMITGSKFPKEAGADFSGIIENAGASIKHFKKGDEVFGCLPAFKGGALAEYIVTAETAISHKPATISFEQASTLPVAGCTSYKIFDKFVEVKPGTEILINGASGGTGMYATQLAKLKGAIVTSVVSTRGVELVKKWGSDFVVDYKKESILDSKKLYDVVIDLSGKLPFAKAKHLMKPKSVYVTPVPIAKEIIGGFFHNLVSRKKIRVLFAKLSQPYFEALKKHIADGLDIVISKTYPMSDVQKAYKETQAEGLLGKVVITI